MQSSSAFAAVVGKMHNGARPSVHPRTGLIQEYPVAPPGANGEPTQPVDEDLDVGHRHFSGMHWLFPGSSPPTTSTSTSGTGEPWLSEALRTAAQKTLMAKRADGGAHTSWSSSWEACLWARLGRGEEAMRSLQRIVDTYTTPHLMSLHPKLQPAGPRHCETCFRERNARPAAADEDGVYPSGRVDGTTRRAMTSKDESIFQLDGNLGYLAAMAEMLLQSHEVGVVRLLPAVPAAWMSAGGEVLGLRARGDVEVSIRWSEGTITAARIVLRSEHPYHYRSGSEGRGGLLIAMPSTPQGQAPLGVSSECADASADGLQRGVTISLPVKSHPCTVVFGNW